VLIPPGDQVGGGMVKNIRAGFLGVFAKLGRDGYQVCFDGTLKEWQWQSNCANTQI
jgi:hypothetical protein